ncbi:MAG: hypothetical protein IKL68_02040 [Clostridia bacterium]|nr:hypothetical protein [Clostridia bacterium]
MEEIKTPILIDGDILNKSKYTDVSILKYTPAEKHPENKCVAIVNFIATKYIVGNTKQEISNLINEELKKEK